MQNLKTLRSEKRHAGKVFNLIVDEIEYPSGNRGIREVAEHPGGSVVVPMLDSETVVLIRQFRYPIKDFLYELPAGKLDSGEDPERCAERELEEETGYKTDSLTRLTAIYTTPGFCTERLHIYLATGLHKLASGQRLEEGEDLTIETFPLKEAIAMIERGVIVDGKSICGLLLAERMLKRTAAHRGDRN